jgi:hypothetical protein
MPLAYVSAMAGAVGESLSVGPGGIAVAFFARE